MNGLGRCRLRHQRHQWQAEHQKAGDGREATLRVCTGCHTPEIILQQRLAPADWALLVDNMAGRGATGTDADFAAITAYLSKSFPAA